MLTQSPCEVQDAECSPAVLSRGVVCYEALHAGHHQRQANPIHPAVQHRLQKGSAAWC